MAALQGYIDIPSTSLTGGTGLTVLEIVAPTNQRVKVLAYGFYFDGTSNSAVPVQAIIARPSSAGTYTSILPNPVEGECTETFQATYNYKNTGSEPTYTAPSSARPGISSRRSPSTRSSVTNTSPRSGKRTSSRAAGSTPCSLRRRPG